MTVIAKTCVWDDGRPVATTIQFANRADIRRDLHVIIHIVPAGTRVLDLGCGDGLLLQRLLSSKPVFARGVEVSEENVRICISRGLSVRHGNIEAGLADFQDHSFDFIILSQTLAYLNRPLPVLREMLRVGRSAIISMDNGAYWRTRWRALAGHGFGPSLTSELPPVRCITPRQFRKSLEVLNLECERRHFLGANGQVRIWPSLFAKTAVYVIRKKCRSN